MSTKIDTKIHVGEGRMECWDGRCQNTKVDWRSDFGCLIIGNIFKFVCQSWKIASCISCLRCGKY